MAVTRINNNQISDASAGNSYVGINAATKIQPYSITATKIANNLTYGSDLTITGNLTVQGNTTAIDTTYTTIEDPILLLASTQTGAPSVDIGFIGERGTSDNIAFVWDESSAQFVTAYTTTGESNTTITIASYADIHSGNAVVEGTLSTGGSISVTGNITGGNLNSNAQVVSTGNITGGNLITAGLASVTGNVTGGNLVTAGQVSATGNVTGGNLVTAGQAAVTGNITGGNLITAGLGSFGTTVDVVGNITGGNLVTAGQAAVTGNITGGNLVTAGQVSATGNVTGGNVSAGSGIISTTGNINGGNINATTNVSAAGGYFTSNVTIIGTLFSTSNIVANTSGTFFGDVVTGNGAIYAGVPSYTPLGSNVVAQFAGNANSYSQINFQNINTGTLASTDYIATADNGNDSSYYLDMGINSSTFDDPVSYPGFFPNDSYVHNHGGNLILNPESAGKTIKMMVGGTDTTDVVAYVSSTGFDITGVVSATGNITGSNVNSNAQIVATGNITGGNLNTAGQVVATGNVTGGNLVTGGRVVATGNIVSSANISGGNLAVTGTINTATLETTGNVLVGGNLTVQGNIQYVNVDDLRVEDPIIIMGTGPNGAPLTTDDGMDRGIYMEWYKTGLGNSWIGWENSSGNLIAAADVVFSANNVVNVNAYGTFQAGNIYGQSAVAEGNITGGNLITAGQVSATGNVTGGNLVTGAQVVATGNITGGNLITAGLGSFGTTVSATGNITGGNLNTAGQVVATGNITGGNLNTAGLGSFGTTVDAAGNITGGNLVTAGQAVVTGNVTGGNLVTAGQAVVTGNVTGGNIVTAGLGSFGTTVTATGNITGGNLVTAGQTVSTGNVTGGNLVTAGQVSATGNVTGGNIVTAGLGSFGTTVDVTGNITGGNLNSNAQVVATGNVTGGNLITAGLASVTGNITGGNLITAGSGTIGNFVISGSNINSDAARITVNSNGTDVDFAVDSDATANVLYVDAGTGTVSIGSSTQTTNAALAINATNSFLMPVGNTAQRPGTGVTGMLRFNSTTNGVEVYNATEWATVGTPSFTVISDQQFNGDGSNVAFTLSAATTTNSTIVSINGIVQIPTIAYSVGGVGANVLTFTEAPLTGDIIDVRALTTTTQVVSISNSPGNAIVEVNPTINEVNITGNLIPTGNATQSLGSASQQWKDIYVAGNTIYLGGLQLTASGSTFTVYQSDGTTPALANTTISTTNNITVGGILNAGANGTGNIGNSTSYFNTVHAKATSAQYADLAENYVADAEYAPGTVLSFGGTNEVTVSTLVGDRRIAGVVSTNPSYVMNAVLEAEHVATIALTGRVPTLVSGPVEKGDMMVSAGNGRAVACATPAMGTVIGKALENNLDKDSVIEIVVGRL